MTRLRFIIAAAAALVLAAPTAAQQQTPIYRDRNGNFQGAEGVMILAPDGSPTGTTGQPTKPVSSAASSALSGTISASGGTAAIVLTAATRSEIINPAGALMCASFGTPAVSGSGCAAGSFPIAVNGSYVADRVGGTLTLLSTAAAQPYTVNRFTF